MTVTIFGMEQTAVLGGGDWSILYDKADCSSLDNEEETETV